MKHIFIFNPNHFHEQQWKIDGVFDNIGQYFRNQKNSEFSTQIPRYPRETIGIVQKQIDELKDGDSLRVYAIGGEEVMFDCLNGIAELTNADLAIMPHGHRNDFLGLFGEEKLGSFNDIDLMAESPSISTDLIKAGNVFVLNCCTAGLGSIIAMRNKDIKNKKGMVRFYAFRRFVALLKNINLFFNRKLTAHYYNIKADGVDYSGNYISINVANGPRCDGRITALTDAVPNDGMLDVALLKTTRSIAALFSFTSFSRGKIPGNCVVFRAKKITIQSEEPFLFRMDSEFIRETSISMEIVPKAVHIVTADMSYPLPNGAYS